MNKEFNENNYQGYSHQEGQQNNIAENRLNKGTNEPPTHNAEGGMQHTANQRQEGEEGRAEDLQNLQTESDLANEMEDEGLRGGNSSI